MDRVIHASEVIVHPLPARRGPRDAAGRAPCSTRKEIRNSCSTRKRCSKRRTQLRSQRSPDAESAPHILVIDDSLTSRVLLQSILEAGGYKVDLAVSGEDAMAKARERHYSLFVCDVEMPGMNGFEFVSRTREYDYLLGHSFDPGHHPRRAPTTAGAAPRRAPAPT